MTNTEIRDRIAAQLKRAGIPTKRVMVLGQYVHVTCYGEESAYRAANLLTSAGFRMHVYRHRDVFRAELVEWKAAGRIA